MAIKTLLSVGLFLLVSTAGICHANHDEKSKVEVNPFGQIYSLTSKVLEEERQFIVKLPAGYHQQKQQNFPVVYVLDGEKHFTHLGSMISHFSANRLADMPPAILVGIINTKRTRDYTPKKQTGAIDTLLSLVQPETGGVDRFLNFIETELVTHINQRYRTSGFNLLIGHSFGGLVALEALRTKPKLFNGYVMLDPSLWYDYPNYLNRLKDSLDEVQPHAAVYMATAGRLKKSNHKKVQLTIQAQRELAAFLKQKTPSPLHLIHDNYLDENHGSLVHIATHNGLRKLFAGYRIGYKQAPMQSTELMEQYHKLSTRFGIEIKPHQFYLEQLSQFVGKRNPDPKSAEQAIEALIDKYYPDL